MRNISIQKEISRTWLFAIVVLTVCTAIIWTGDSSIDERVITNRYFLFSMIALTAFLTPYILFPDKDLALIQLGNLSSSAIQKHTIKNVFKLAWPVYLLIILLFFADLNNPFEYLVEKTILTISSLSLFSGILLLSIVRYTGSGESSQYWKESAKGERQERFSVMLKYHQVDPSSLPSLINTILIFSLGSMSIVIGAFIQIEYSIFFEMIFFMLVLVSGIYQFKKSTQSLDRNFYKSDSFFREFFGDTVKSEMAGDKREVDQLWWVPARLKMHVWQFLLQIDRKIPAGRAVAAGHVAVWFIAYQRPDPQFLVVIWILFALAHQLFIIMSIQLDMAPYWMLRWVDKSSIWTLSRFWMQLRWLVPMLLSMNLQHFLFDVPGYYEQGVILLIYILSSVILSFAGTVKLKHDLKI